MRDFFTKLLKQISDFLSGLSSKEKKRLILLAVVVVGLGIAVALILGRVEYSVLYNDLSAGEAGELLQELEAMGIPVKTQGTSTILIPSDMVTETRMRLSAGGYQSGDLDYSIFQQGTGFGTNDAEKSTYAQYQLQQFIRTLILKVDKIKECTVILSMQKESSYVKSAYNQPATASILIEVKNGGTLTGQEAISLAETVSKAVPGLTVENIRILDTNLNLYSTNQASLIDGEGNISYQMQLEQTTRDRIEQQVQNLLTPVFGYNRVKNTVHVALNFDSEVVQSVEFAPPVPGSDEGLIVSMSELYENSRYADGAGGVVGTDSNGMGTVEYPYGELGEDELYSKVLREMNYEINETTRQIEKAKGGIRELSIAIIIDSGAISEDYTSNVRNLVANAIGVDDTYISVERLPFVITEDTFSSALGEQEAFMRSMQIREIIRMAIIGIIILLLALAVISLVKTIVKSASSSKQGVVMADGTGMNIDYIAGDDTEEELLRRDIEITKSEEVDKIEKFIDKDPQAVAQLLRNWLSDE
ncbi:MAG: flagellar M-ring protein FliF [Oscillospiraceae bacterium]|jgi:flagellar M-ring protein FliF|nr:flagellar M-ring protein FliF [Oscillospiraceae bacterium]